MKLLDLLKCILHICRIFSRKSGDQIQVLFLQLLPGVFHQILDIGAQVKMGDVAATVDGVPMTCTLDGVLRGILPDDTPVHKGMKAGDIDPRCKVEHCYTASDKALAIGGGVLEAILDLTGALKDRAGGYSG